MLAAKRFCVAFVFSISISACASPAWTQPLLTVPATSESTEPAAPADPVAAKRDQNAELLRLAQRKLEAGDSSDEGATQEVAHYQSILAVLAQQHGYVHGGVISYAADNAVTFAGGSVLGPAVVTSGLSIQYVRPAQGSTLRAVADVVTVTASQAVVRCEVLVAGDDGESVCAVAQGTVRPLHPRPEPRPDHSVPSARKADPTP